MRFLSLLSALLCVSCVYAASDSPENSPVPKTVYEKLSLTKIFPQENTDTLIIRGHHAVVAIKQSAGKEFALKVVAQEWPKGAELKIFKSRNGKALIVDATVPHKSLRVDFIIIVPKGVNVRMAGGVLEASLEGLEGDVFADAGRLILKAQGGALANFKGSAGDATVDIGSIQKDFLLACGGGNIKVHYTLPAQPKKDGLRIGRAPTVTVRQGAGSAQFSFPPTASVFYKSFSGVTAPFLSESKQFDVRCLFYTAPGVQVGLSKE